MEKKHTLDELTQWQHLSLRIKVAMTKERIRNWIDWYGSDGVYVAFSGGKDSTVLLHMVREEYPDVVACFCDTGLEYPEIRNFVKTFDNVDWLKPKMTFRQVIDTYGYPFISKSVGECVYKARRYLAREGHENQPQPAQLRELLGTYSNTNSYIYNKSRYKFLLDAPFVVTHKCCEIMKKNPTHDYAKRTGKVGMTAQMAEESELRTSQWLKNGCNGFDMKNPISNPMAFWTEQDVLKYIKENNIKIASVYGDIVPDYEKIGQLDGQMSMFEEDIPLKTTGAKRTGCMFCGFGCHLDGNPSRFERMKETHPTQYDYIMRPREKGGLDYKNVIDWINEHGNLKIRY